MRLLSRMTQRRRGTDQDYHELYALRQEQSLVGRGPHIGTLGRFTRRLRQLSPLVKVVLAIPPVVSTIGIVGGVFHRGWGEAITTAAALVLLFTLTLGNHKFINRHLPWANRRSTVAALQQARSGAAPVVLFNRLWGEAKRLLDDPPDWHYYDAWLRGAETQIAQYSQALAAEWNAPEAARGRPQDDVSSEVIEQRLERIQTLHRRVAHDGVPLQELARAGFPGAEAQRAAGAA
jgi:hypothetical protein